VVGSESGLVRILNTQDPTQIVMIFRERLHSSAVTSITITSHHICTGGQSGTVVILKNDPLKVFPLIGLLQLKSSVIALGVPSPLSVTQQLLIATGHREVMRIDLPDEPVPDFRIGLEMLHRAMLKVGNRVLALTAEPSLREDQQYFYCACDDKSIRYYCMPVTTGDLDLVGVDDVESSAPDDVFGGHSKAVTSVMLAPSQVFLATGCAGGCLILRELDVKTAQVRATLFTATHHNPLSGAITGIAFSGDGRKFFTVGYDGAINMYAMRIQPCPLLRDNFEVPPPTAASKVSVSKIFEIEQQIKNLKDTWENRDYDYEAEDPTKVDDEGPGLDETSLPDQMKRQRVKNQRSEASQYRDLMMVQLTAIQEEFMGLVKDNEEASELEKLTQTDFTLDTVSSERLQQPTS
jgi:WD40 repeat protein